jgi:uncharacterized LabA/DUF88 family protein
LSEARLKIAVFIDFDNIEIGVKTTLGAHFDVGAVLEAIKERGEVVTKVAYGDWTRAGDYSRSLTQHAIQMVQRNLTPGGDKNGADINLALDALELAFTHNHINAFVIVGGDSDFMALVEKLKLYDRQVFVVGGRAFTSMILQKNCTEFIAYENVTGRRSSPRGGGGKDVRDALPLVKRALKVLADREVMPQLGVLKSTLLQLDSTFSEREYGVSTFRDFVQKLERAGGVTLKGTDRSILVELREGGSAQSASPADRDVEASTPEAPAAAQPPATAPAPAASVRDGSAVLDMAGNDVAPPAPASSEKLAEGFAIIRDVFVKPGLVTRWPLYVRQAKQLLKNADESFDERKFGFNGIIDALRYCQREGLFRLERDRQGVIRIYPGETLEPGATDGSQAGAGSKRVAASTAPTAASLPLDPDEALDRALDGNRLAPGEKPAPPPPSARRRAGRGRTAVAETASAVEAAAVPDAPSDTATEDAASASAAEPVEATAPVAGEGQAQDDATHTDKATAAKSSRTRSTATRKRVVKKAVKKTAKKTAKSD